MIPFFKTHEQNYRIAATDALDFPAHLHQELELVLVQSGKLLVQINEEERLLERNELAFIAPGCVHRYQTVERGGPDAVIMLIVSPDLLGACRPTLLHTHPADPFFSVSQAADVHWAIRRLRQLAAAPGSVLLLQSYLQVLCAALLGQTQTVRSEQDSHDSLAYRAIRFLQEQYQRPLNLETAAGELGVGKYTLSRMFSNDLRCNFNDCLNAVRAFRARSLLCGTDDTVTQIAFQCGFNSLRTFHRAYRKRFGCTPRESWLQREKRPGL